MSTRRFCDVCDRLLDPMDDVPFIRCSDTKDIQVSLIVTNSSGGVVNDLCNICKTEIVMSGRTIEQVAKGGRKVVEIDAPSHSEFPHPNLSTRTSAGGGGGSHPLQYEPSLKPKESNQQQKPEPKPKPQGT